MRNIIIGDVHGCFDELSELLNKLSITINDKIYFVGDIVDKGPKQIECINLIMSLPNCQCILGNHESKAKRYIDWQIKSKETGVKNPMTSVSNEDKEVYDSLNQKQIDWLFNLPISIWLFNFNTRLIHGGFLPKIDIEKQIIEKEREVIRLRFVNEDGKFVGLHNGPQQPKGTKLWSEVYDGDCHVVYGHISHDLISPRVDVREDGIKCIGLDTGCVVGGHLTALILETGEFVQVKAKQKYAEAWKE